jgi:mannose/fructose/N-acetylgalactosamine-specific phosphotransferase system component IIC
MDVADGLLNALGFGLLLTQMLGHRPSNEASKALSWAYQ